MTGSQPDIGIVAGNDDVGAETAGLVSQCAEFDVPVAHDAVFAALSVPSEKTFAEISVYPLHIL